MVLVHNVVLITAKSRIGSTKLSVIIVTIQCTYSMQTKPHYECISSDEKHRSLCRWWVRRCGRQHVSDPHKQCCKLLHPLNKSASTEQMQRSWHVNQIAHSVRCPQPLLLRTWKASKWVAVGTLSPIEECHIEPTRLNFQHISTAIARCSCSSLQCPLYMILSFEK